jgi:hypothetical protein
LDKDIKDDRSTRKMDCGQLNKKKKPSMDSLDHCEKRKERQVGEALKTWVKLIPRVLVSRVLTLRFRPKVFGELL